MGSEMCIRDSMMALAVVSLPYDKSLLFNSQLQVVFLMALFQIVYWRVRSDGVIDSPTPNVNHDMVGSRTR